LFVLRRLQRLVIELCHLRYVVAAAEQRSFRGAAKALSVQESSISRRIRDLEDEIGAALFIRSHEGVKLTYAGQRFLYRARIALDQIGHAVTDVGAIGRAEDGAVRIGILSSMASGFLAELFQAFDAGHAGVRLEFVDGAPSDHFAAIRQHRLDVAFVTGDPALTDCDVTQLWTERLFVALPSHHKLAVLSEVDWPDLRGQPLVFGEARPESDIGDFLVKRLVEAGDRPMVERHGVGRDSLMQIVALGRGLTLISEAATAMHFPGVIYRPLLGEELAFSAVWSPRNENPALRCMLSLARKMSEARSPVAPNGDPVFSKQKPMIDSVALSQTRDPSP
jgi:DNA-binding transcriptional LysR family regulator